MTWTMISWSSIKKSLEREIAGASWFYSEKGIQTPVAQGRSTHFDDQVDSDQQVVNTELSLYSGGTCPLGADVPLEEDGETEVDLD